MLNHNPHPNHNRKTVCNSNLTLTLTLIKTLNLNPKYNTNLLSYQGVGRICKRFMLMTTIKVQKPGNIGTGEHRHRGTSVPGNIGTGKHRYAPILYADDTALISNISNFKSTNAPISTTESINDELGKISNWLAVNKLSLNAGKSNYMVFRHKYIILHYGFRD